MVGPTSAVRSEERPLASYIHIYIYIYIYVSVDTSRRGGDHVNEREMGGAPRNHPLARIVKSSGCAAAKACSRTMY